MGALGKTVYGTLGHSRQWPKRGWTGWPRRRVGGGEHPVQVQIHRERAAQAHATAGLAARPVDPPPRPSLPLLLLPSFPRYLVECASAAWSARPRAFRNALLCFVTLCAESARRVTPRCRYTLVAGLQSTLPTAQASQLSPAGAHVERAHVALEAVCAHFGNWSQRRTAPQPALGSCVNSVHCETLVDCPNRHHRRYRFSRFPRMVVF